MTLPSVKWMFTAWAEHDPSGPKFDPKYHEYMCTGYEECPTTKKMHWQSYVEFKRSTMPFSYKLKADSLGLTQKLKFKKANGTAESNRNYCSGNCKKKEFKLNDIFHEFGEPVTQGQRTDLDGTCQAIIRGEKTCKDIMIENSSQWCRNYRAFDILEKSVTIKRPTERNCKAIYIYGPSGIGKTHLARKLAVGDYYEAPIASKFWVNYKGQTTIIINEVNYEIFHTYNILWWNNLIDNTSVDINVQYGFVPCCATTFIFTSNHPLSEVLSYVKPEQAIAFKSRITRLIKAEGTDKRRRNVPVVEEVINLD